MDLPNTISPTYQCSIYTICSNIVNFLLHILASDFIIVVELDFEIAFSVL